MEGEVGKGKRGGGTERGGRGRARGMVEGKEERLPEVTGLICLQP